ncbi:MAG: hypothetical protein OSJ60_01940 [Lachnospiraceae bacterium]|nr:hypothetical protein C819_02237 [Lachnospiraceae bacterium 10-1]MCX4350374.1 hypothetical protein [Lachnospiraceae bacterium]
MIDEPRIIEEGYAYIDEQSEKWCLKNDAPDWAVEEFIRVFGEPEPDENGLITLN